MIKEPAIEESVEDVQPMLGLNEEDKKKNDRSWILKFTACGVMLFFVIQYVRSLIKLGGTSNSMMNKFSALAKDNYLDYLILQNLYVIIGYVLVGVVFLFLLWPFLSVLATRFGERKNKRLWCLAMALLGCFLIHGFFILRMVKSRPYFLEDGQLGHWYFVMLSVVPETVKPAVYFVLFTIVPWLFLGYVLIWYWRKFSKGLRIGSLATLFVIFGVFGIKQYTDKKRSNELAQSDEKKWNVIIIGSDSLRSDRLGVNGYKPNRNDGFAAEGVSPNIDRLAARSLNFLNCFTPIASTMESGTSLMSSQYPHTHGLRQMYPRKDNVKAVLEGIHPIARILQKEGYDTAAIGDWCAGYYELLPMEFEDIDVSSYDNFKVYMSQAVMMSHFIIPLYFDNPVGYKVFPQIGSFAQFVTPEVVTDRVEKRLKQASKSGEPFFWHVFYSCNHLPYSCPEPYLSMFTDPSYQGKNKNKVDFDIDQFIGGTNLEDKWKALPKEEVRQISDLYDGCTRMFDDNVGRILKALEQSGLSENTIVIVTADHGDNLYEEGVTLGHGLTFNGGLQANHVPLVVHVPGKGARVIPEHVSILDIMPTLADLLKVEKPEVWEGQSVAGWIEGNEQPKSRAYYGETGFPFVQFRVEGIERPELPAMDNMTEIDEAFNFQFVMKEDYVERLVAAKQRCLVTEKWKLICTPTKEGNRHFGLFQRGTKGGADIDVSNEYPEVLAQMQKALELWMDQRVETSIEEMFPIGEL